MSTENQRFLSLDILRGLTIAFMILVNDPGSWGHVYAPLLHADWNGLTPTDFIFPTFLFIVGVSIVLSFSKNLNKGVSKNQLVKKTFFRALKIYLVGVFLWLWPDFDFSNVRWVGVLQRIAVVFLVCGLIYLYVDIKKQFWISVILITGYWLIMVYLPVPGIGSPDLSVPEKNWANYIDHLLLPGKLWQGTWDPEGVLSTLPAIATGIFGMIAGYIITKKDEISNRLVKLFFYGFCMLFFGEIISWFFPINKSLWSSSFAVFMAGISSLALAASVYLIDVLGKYSYFKFAHVFGVNSIFSYALAGVLTVIFYSDFILGFRLNTLFMDAAIALGFAPKFASLAYALLYIGVIFIPTYVLFKRKIYIKL